MVLASVFPSTFISSCSTSDNSPCNQQQKRRDPETAFENITLLIIRQVKNLLLILVGERCIEIIGEFARAPIKPDRSTVTAYCLVIRRAWILGPSSSLPDYRGSTFFFCVYFSGGRRPCKSI